MLARTHKMYIHLKALIALRKSCIALRSGDIDWITASNDRGGILAFSRVIRGSRQIISMVNPGGSSGIIPGNKILLDHSVAARKGTFVNVFNPAEIATIGFEGNQGYLYLPAGFAVPAGGVSIFAEAATLSPFDPNLGVSLCKP